MTCRRRVDDDQVEAAGVVQLVQLLHRHVFLRATHRARNVAIEGVAEDALRLDIVGRVARDEFVERRLRVEHHRRESTVGRGITRRPASPVDLTRLVRQRADAECVGEPARGIDRHHARVPPAARALERNYCRGRGLADTAAAATDHDLAFGDEFLELHRCSIPAVSAVASVSRWARSMSGVKTNGRSIWGRGNRSRRRSFCACCKWWRTLRKSAACNRSRASRSETKRCEACASRKIVSRSAGAPTGSGWKHWLTTTGPSAMPSGLRSRRRCRRSRSPVFLRAG